MKKSKYRVVRSEQMPEDAEFQVVADNRLLWIGVSMYHFDLFLGMPHGSDILMIYLFYLKTSQIQKTNMIWCTNTFVKKGLGIGEERILRAKKSLEKLGLIEAYQFLTKSNKFGKTYIHLKYVETKELRDNIRKHFLNKIKEELIEPSIFGLTENEGFPVQGKQGSGEKAGPLELPVPGKPGSNALRILKDNINALRKINLKSKYHSFTDGKSYFHKDLRFYLNIFGIMRNPPPEIRITDSKHPNNKFYLYISKRLAKINEDFYERKFKDSNKWTNDIRLLAQQDIGCNGVPTKAIKKRMKNVLQYHGQVIGNDFAHVLQSGKSFRKKFFDVEGAMKRKDSFNKSENDNPHLDGSQFTFTGF